MMLLLRDLRPQRASVTPNPNPVYDVERLGSGSILGPHYHGIAM